MVANNEILMKQFFESYSNWFIQKQTHTENAEKLASACGTFVSQKTTLATDSGSESGKGTVREGHEYLCHPDIIKSINIGQCILLEQGPKCLSLINIRDAKKSAAFKNKDKVDKSLPISPVLKTVGKKQKL